MAQVIIALTEGQVFGTISDVMLPTYFRIDIKEQQGAFDRPVNGDLKIKVTVQDQMFEKLNDCHILPHRLLDYLV